MQTRLGLPHFGARDIVPIGYAVFAFALGVTAGLLFRRFTAGMLTALIGFVAVREIVTSWVRPNLIAPFHESLPITAATPVSVVDLSRVSGPSRAPEGPVFRTRGSIRSRFARTAQAMSHVLVPQPSVPLGNYGPLNPRGCTARLAAKFHQVVTYQPGSHYWPMQWYELAIVLALAIVLGGFCFCGGYAARFVTFFRCSTW